MPLPTEVTRRLALLLAALAATRVLVLVAAFPPFNPVDELFHYDLVVKYADGHVPLRLSDEHLGMAARDAVVLYGSGLTTPRPGFFVLHHSPEYMNLSPAGDVAPPVWTAPPGIRDAVVQYGRSQWNRVNFEALDPPLYYAVAGGWHRLGRVLGVAGGHLFYWTRALDVLIAVALVWITWRLARDFFPSGSLVGFGAPLLVAIFPQDAQYSVSTDALAPLVFGAACYALLGFATRDEPSVALGVVAGLAVATTLLTKGSTMAILAVAVIAMVASYRRRAMRSFPALAALVITAAVPMMAWLARFVVAGAPGPVVQKAATLGWTPKPLAEVWAHPIFTLAGAASYLSESLALFWRGELVWHRELLAFPALDAFYVVSSLALVVIAALHLVVERGKTRLAGTANLVAVVGTMLWLVVLSVSMTFSKHVSRPSPQFPSFSGRLLICTLVPFALVYIAGLEALLVRIRIARFGVAIILALAAIVTAGELALATPAFRSAYNWFGFLGST